MFVGGLSSACYMCLTELLRINVEYNMIIMPNAWRSPPVNSSNRLPFGMNVSPFVAVYCMSLDCATCRSLAWLPRCISLISNKYQNSFDHSVKSVVCRQLYGSRGSLLRLKEVFVSEGECVNLCGMLKWIFFAMLDNHLRLLDSCCGPSFSLFYCY